MEIKPTSKMQITANNNLAIVHVGCGGGTGGILASNALKLIGGLSPLGGKRVSYIGCDGDIFEEKNLGRQLCIPHDIGKNKAEVIIGRYSNAYRLDPDSITYAVEYMKTMSDLSQLLFANSPVMGQALHLDNTGTVKFNEVPGSSSERRAKMNAAAITFLNTSFCIIDTVDKALPRSLLHKFVTNFKESVHNMVYTLCNSRANLRRSGDIPGTCDLYVISCGNGEWTGQTVLGRRHLTISISEENSDSFSVSEENQLDASVVTYLTKPYSFSAATAFEKFSNLIDLAEDKREEEMSCADRAVENVQTMNANNFAATFALNYLALIMRYVDLSASSSGPALVGMTTEELEDYQNKKAALVTHVGECKYSALTNYVRNVPFGED